MIFSQAELSNHCKITLQIPNMINLKTNSAPYKWVHLKRAYKWSDNLGFRYQKAFNKGEIQKVINDLKQNYSTDNIDTIGKRVIDILDILQAVGKVSLPKTKIANSNDMKTRNTMKKNKIWFDQDCDKLKKDISVLSAKEAKSPLDNEVREKFNSKMKEFKNLCHQKRKLFWNKKIEDLNDDFHKKDETFWNKWRNFSETSVNKHVDINDGKQWENYYKNLLTERNKNDNKLNDEGLPYNIDLNKEITLDEVKKILKKLKKKKAVGVDRLSNEMLKNTPIHFIEIILQVFNKCLKTRDIPKIW